MGVIPYTFLNLWEIIDKSYAKILQHLLPWLILQKHCVYWLFQKKNTVPRDQINPSQDEDRLASKITYSFKKEKISEIEHSISCLNSGLGKH